jgi:hypothetical protein
VVREIEINPAIEDGFFDKTEVDFGPVTCDGQSVEGLVKSSYYGYLQSNIQDKDLASLGIADRDWLNLTVGEHTIKVKYVKELPRRDQGGGDLDPSNILLCRYGRYPRLMLLSQAVSPEDMIPFNIGDKVVLTRAEQGATKEQDRKN